MTFLIDSPDVTLREEIISLDGPDSELIIALLECSEIWQEQKNITKVLRDRYFAPRYGTSANILLKDFFNSFKQILNLNEGDLALIR